VEATSGQSRNSHTDDQEKASLRGKKQTAGMPAAEGARKRAVRRGGNIHIQDEDQAPTGKNAGDMQAATEAAKAASEMRGNARTVAGAGRSG
jgi:hypothetical protein